MKNILFLFVLLLTAFTISCDDSFLDENKKQMEGYNLDVSLLVEPISQVTEVSITLPDLKNKDFKVFQYPKTIHFETFDGHIDETGKLTFRIKVDAFDRPLQIEPINLGNIILNIEEFGLLSIKVQSVNWGTPNVSISNNLIDFDIDYNDRIFEIRNSATGVLFYKLVKKPSWIKEIRNYYISNDFIEIDSVKALGPGGIMPCLISTNIENLTPGVHEDVIVFETSDPANPVLTINVKIRIRSYENPTSMIPIEGTVMDAEFDKSTNTLFLVTQNPAKLTSYNIVSKIKKEKLLDRNPYCISLSEDKTKLILGATERLEIYNSSDIEKIETVDLEFVVSDAVDGNNGLYYFCNPNYEVFSYNSSTKTRLKHTSGWEYVIDGDVMLKLKGKPYILLSKKGYSPNGITLANISDKTKMQFVENWHSGFGDRYWTTEDQVYVFSQMGIVYRLPNENTGTDIYKIGQLIPYDSSYENFYDFKWFDHSTATSKIWASYDLRDWSKKNIIISFDDKTYERKQQIEMNDYVATVNGKKDYYMTLARYIFSSGSGNEVVVVKNVTESNVNAWHLEIIDVTK